MKFVKLFSLVLAICFTSTLFGQKNLPNVNVKDLSGKTINIQEFGKNGKITVISFWATWCAPCKKELDTIAKTYKNWQKDYNVELVAVTIDKARALPKVTDMVKDKGWDYIVLSDAKQELQEALGFQTVPQTFLIDAKGKIVYSHSGYEAGDEHELEKKIKALKK